MMDRRYCLHQALHARGVLLQWMAKVIIACKVVVTQLCHHVVPQSIGMILLEVGI